MTVDDLTIYINDHFPDVFSDYHVRFELGEPYENGSDERIRQVIERAVTLFEETFNHNEIIHLFIKNEQYDDDPLFGNLTPGFIYELIKEHTKSEKLFSTYDDDDEDEGEPISTGQKYLATMVTAQLSHVAYKDILMGVANYEQGRTPAIGQRVYFVNTEKGIMFYMYDDRGCIIYSETKRFPQYMYQKYNDWLDDYYRGDFEALYHE